MSMMNIRSLTAALRADIWAIDPHTFEVVQGVVMERMAGRKPSEAELAARLGDKTYGVQGLEPDALGLPGAKREGALSERVAGAVRADGTGSAGDVMVVSLHGVIISRAGFMDRISGASSPQVFGQELRNAAEDPTVKAIVLDLDTPGGTVTGTDTAAQAVAYAASMKPVYAVLNENALSAGCWIAAQATQVIIPPNGQIGSIGVIATHYDYTAQLAQLGIKPTVMRSTPMKAPGQAAESLDPAKAAALQASLDGWHAAFVRAVAAGRRVDLSVAEGWATGEMWRGQAAVDAGLADRVADLHTIVRELAGEDVEGTGDELLAPPVVVVSPAASAQTPPPAAQGAGTLPPEVMNVDEIMRKMAAGEPLTPAEWDTLQKHAAAQAGATPTAQAPTTAPGEAQAGQQEASAPAPAAQATPGAAEGATAAQEPQLSPEARAAVDAANLRAAQAEQAAREAQQAAQALRVQQAQERYTKEAEALGLPTAYGAVLAEVDAKLAPDVAAQVRAAISAAEVADDLTAEVGTTHGAARASGTAYATAEDELTERARALRASERGLSRMQARDKVLEQDKDLAARVKDERAAASAARRSTR